MKHRLFVSITLLLCLSVTVAAQEAVELTVEEPLVVTATRIAIVLEQAGKTVTLVTAQQLDERQAASLVEALQTIPGVLVRQQRGAGGLASIKIRGLDSEYTQILVDGLPMRDPSDPQGAATEFMSDVMIDAIDRIEVVRGSSSTLYGSDSVGGTINIITRKSAAPFGVFASFEGGSLATYQETAGIHGRTDRVDVALTAKRVDSAGFDDHDTSGETAVTGRASLELAPGLSLTGQVKYVDAQSDLNNTPGILNGVLVKDGDDADDTKTKTLVSGGLLFTHAVSEQLDYTVKFGYVDVDRTFTFGPAGDEFGFGSDAAYAGTTLNVDAQGNYRLNDAHLLTLGGEYETEQFEQVLGAKKDTPDAAQSAVYVQDSMTFGDDVLTIVPGVRYMRHDQAGSRVDWEVSASYPVGESGARLHSHIGTGFRAPSLYELYGASIFGAMLYEFGNPDLDPEDSLGWDFGVELTAFEEMLRVNTTYFSNTFDQIIAFGTVGYENVAGGESRGIETDVEFRPVEPLTISAAYTYTRTEDADGEQFYGVPEHQFGANVRYHIRANLLAHANLSVCGQEEIPLFDSATFLSERYQNDGFTTLEIGMKYAISSNFTVWARVENLLDADYTLGGYQAPGRSLYAGVRWAL